MTNHGKAPQELLEALHGALTEDLLSRIRKGEATSADLSVARQLLKDNGVDAIATEGSGIGDLAKKLPFTETTNPDEDGD